ncbi:MAG: TerB family tellurite resistance protein [SAR324 cluster bacterium]|nr:TerB family tellurite resistance protein [SAR324 cluster bacterium]
MSNLYNKEELHRVMLAGSLILASDDDLNEDEWKTIEGFLKRYWDPEFGDAKEFFKGVIESLRRLLSKGRNINDKAKELAEEMAANFNDPQKDEAMNFLQEIIKADGSLDEEEDRIFKTFFQIVQPR